MQSSRRAGRPCAENDRRTYERQGKKNKRELAISINRVIIIGIIIFIIIAIIICIFIAIIIGIIIDIIITIIIAIIIVIL